MLYFYISMVETPEEKTKVEQLYLNYRQTMYHVAYQILKDSFEQRTLCTVPFCE